MAELFNIELESDLSEFSSTVTDGGDLAWASGGLAGTSGKLSCHIDDTNPIYGEKSFSVPSSGIVRFRFYIDPDGLGVSNGDHFDVCSLRTASTTVCRVEFGQTGGSFIINVSYRPDGGSLTDIVSDEIITDAEHYIEVLFQKATGESNNDGVCTAWIDGVQEGTASGLDIWDNFADMTVARLGAIVNVPASLNDYFYLDEFKMIDANTEIGPVSAGVVPQAAYYQRLLRGG